MRLALVLKVFALFGVYTGAAFGQNAFQTPEEIVSEVVVRDQFNISIQTPDLQARRTSKLILANGLKVLIISDPGIVKAGAALSVETGSWRDPPGVSGLGISQSPPLI
jgi:hypothetical protein